MILALPLQVFVWLSQPAAPNRASDRAAGHLRASAYADGFTSFPLLRVQPFEFARRRRFHFDQVIKAEKNQMLPADDPILGVCTPRLRNGNRP